LVAGDAGIVDQDGGRAELGTDVLYQFLRRTGLVDIQPDTATLVIQRLETFTDRSGAIGARCGAHHDRSQARQPVGNGSTDSATGPGDQGYLPFQAPFHFKPTPE